MKGGLALCSVAKSSSFSEVPKVSLPQRLLPTSWLKKKKKKSVFTSLFFKIWFFKSRLSDPVCVCVEQLPEPRWLFVGHFQKTQQTRSQFPISKAKSPLYEECFQTRLCKSNGNSERIYNSRWWDASNMGHGHVNWSSPWTRIFSPPSVIQSHVYSINCSVSPLPAPRRRISLPMPTIQALIYKVI